MLKTTLEGDVDLSILLLEVESRKTQNPKYSKIQNFVSANVVLQAPNPTDYHSTD